MPKDLANGFFQIGTVAEKGDEGFDPTNPGLGWIPVSVGFVNPEVHWCRAVFPYASVEFGVGIYPEVGDKVLVVCVENTEWVCLGSIYTLDTKAKVTNDEGSKYGKNFTKELIRTKMGTAITIHDEEGKESITVDVKEGKIQLKMDMDSKSISLTSEDVETVDVIVPNAVTNLECKDLHAKIGDAKIDVASGKIDVDSKDITINVTGKVTLEASAKVVIKGASVEIC